MKPLTGILVVDLSKVLAGPLSAQILGDLGADVIKVEPVENGDDMRTWVPQDKGQSTIFLSVNRNKRSIALDLKAPEGLEAVHRLVRKADVVIQGFGTGTAERLGVDYAALSKLKDDLVYCEISGYGREGPLAHKPGYDVMAQAFSGILSTLGEPEGPIMRVSFSPIDQGTGMHAATGILAALMERGRSGKGSYLSVSLLDTAIGFLGYMAQNYWHTGMLPRRMGSAHEAAAPYQAFEAADGPLMIGVGNDLQWKRFCKACGLDAFVDDTRFKTVKARVANFTEVIGLVVDVIGKQTVAHWIERLEAAGVPCSPINTLAEVLEHPQLEAIGIMVETEHRILGNVRSIGYPVKFNNEPRSSSRPAPVHGEHTAEILAEIGYTPAEIEKLRNNKHVLCESGRSEK